MHTKFLSENLKSRDHSEDLDVYGRIILEFMLGKQGEKLWTGCIWLRTGTSGRVLGLVNTVMNITGGNFLH
jgi:hypothetical protein